MASGSGVTHIKSDLESYLRVLGNRIQNLDRQHAELVEKMDHPRWWQFMDEGYAEEEVGRLREQVAALDLHGKKTVEQDRDRAKEVFGLLMRAGFRREKDEHSKFQPCKEDLDFLKGMDPALCRRLRAGSLKDFCFILHPAANGSGNTAFFDDDGDTVRERIERRDSIFHLHRNSAAADYKEFQDQTARANALAQEIKQRRKEKRRNRYSSLRVSVSLLDGHGRMLVCLIKAVMDLDLDPDEVLRMTVFEMDEEVHQYHRYVFPRCVVKRKRNVIDIRNVDEELQENSVIYLNFCSVTSGDYNAWSDYFDKQTTQTDREWEPHCCKENVLKYIWHVTHHPYYCTVMISLVIKDMQDGAYYGSLCRSLGDYITGVGFLRFLRNETLFNAELVSVRPGDGIKWTDADSKRYPGRVKSGKMGCPFVTLLIRPLRSRGRAELKKLDEKFKEWKIADTEDYTMRVGAEVRTASGKRVRISKRTVATLYTDDGDSFRISTCEPMK